MPVLRRSGTGPWNVTKLGTVSPQIIQNADGTQATLFAGLWTDTVQTGKTVTVYDWNGAGAIPSAGIFSTIAQAVNSLAAAPDGGAELTNGLAVEFKAGVAGAMYVFWK